MEAKDFAVRRPNGVNVKRVIRVWGQGLFLEGQSGVAGLLICEQCRDCRDLIAGKPLSAHRELGDFGPRGESQFEPVMSFGVEGKAVTGRINACRNVPF